MARWDLALDIFVIENNLKVVLGSEFEVFKIDKVHRSLWHSFKQTVRFFKVEFIRLPLLLLFFAYFRRAISCNHQELFSEIAAACNCTNKGPFGGCFPGILRDISVGTRLTDCFCYCKKKRQKRRNYPPTPTTTTTTTTTNRYVKRTVISLIYIYKYKLQTLGCE